MTDQQIIDTYNEMAAHYGEVLPNFEQEPRRFAYYVKMFMRMKALQVETQDEQQT